MNALSSHFLGSAASLSLLLSALTVSAQKSAPDRAPKEPSSKTAAAPSESAQESERLEAALVQLNASGVRLYSERQYAAARERFSEAYVLHPAPSLLFNIASCWEKEGNAKEAISTYEQFLDLASQDDPGRARAEAKLRVLRKKERPAASPTNESGKTGGPRQISRAATPREPRAGAAGSDVRWYLLGSGLGVAALSATLYWLGHDDHQSVTQAVGYHNPSVPGELTRAEAQSLIRSGDTKKVAGAIGAGLGALLVGTFTYLQLSDASEPPAALSGFVGPTGGGLSYRGTF